MFELSKRTAGQNYHSLVRKHTLEHRKLLHHFLEQRNRIPVAIRRLKHLNMANDRDRVIPISHEDVQKALKLEEMIEARVSLSVVIT